MPDRVESRSVSLAVRAGREYCHRSNGVGDGGVGEMEFKVEKWRDPLRWGAVGAGGEEFTEAGLSLPFTG